MSWQPGAALGPVLAVAVLACGSARADSGELRYGGAVSYFSPDAAGASAALELGLTDVLAARASLGGVIDAQQLVGRGGVELVLAWDVLAWVPELSVGAFGQGGGEDWFGVGVSLGVRRYLTQSLALALGGGAEWASGATRAVATLALWFG